MGVECVRIGDATLYYGDCREILPSLDGVDVLITDPPYGTGWARGGGKRAGSYKKTRQRAEWDVWSLDWLPLVQAHTYAVFCPSIHLAELLGQYGKSLRYYIKSNPLPGCQGADAFSVEPIVIWPRIRYSRGPAHRIAYNDDSAHPCGKPLSIMTWLVSDLAAPYECVLDPFAGGFTTGVAAILSGRRAICIEQDAEWFDFGCHRIEAAYKQLNLFPILTTETSPTQLALMTREA